MTGNADQELSDIYHRIKRTALTFSALTLVTLIPGFRPGATLFGDAHEVSLGVIRLMGCLAAFYYTVAFLFEWFNQRTIHSDAVDTTVLRNIEQNLVSLRMDITRENAVMGSRAQSTIDAATKSNLEGVAEELRKVLKAAPQMSDDAALKITEFQAQLNKHLDALKTVQGEKDRVERMVVDLARPQKDLIRNLKANRLWISNRRWVQFFVWDCGAVIVLFFLAMLLTFVPPARRAATALMATSSRLLADDPISAPRPPECHSIDGHCSPSSTKLAVHRDQSSR